jgi:anti-sigma regulatory factor (Ser/Thr protein kinase)/serine/threonine protein phosphatase PrpC
MREINSIEIKDEAHVGTARRFVHGFASDLGFSEQELAEIDIVVQEIGTNAARYADAGGRIHYTQTLGEATGLELFYWDTGPGIHDLDRAVRDGVSTSGSLGAGLGAIRRLMDEFDVYSTVRKTARLSLSQRRSFHGTALLARKWLRGAEKQTSGRDEARRYGIWSRPYPGERMSGDAYLIREWESATLIAVIDGLGHGSGAKVAADAALDSLEDWAGEPLDEVLQVAHDALRSTRGAAIGAVIIDRGSARFHYAGVGNVAARVFNAPERISPISTNGTLGAQLGRLRVWSHPWSEGATLVMASDGISESWDIELYPGLINRCPQLLAGVLMRDFGRDTDDATVLVAR